MPFDILVAFGTLIDTNLHLPELPNLALLLICLVVRIK